jgi:energy-coupling factor transporter ATP-binding protein EcfA2
MKRVKLPLAPGLDVEFAGRDAALRQVAEWADRGTRLPVVIFGPEGCGKSALFKQAAAMLMDLGYDVVYVDVAHKTFVAHTDVAEVARRLVETVSDASGIAQLRLAYLAVDLARELIGRWGKRKVAVLVDEVFQAVGLDRAGMYVKSLLNLIEYPPKDYERIVALIATSEGLTRREIGRHLWARLMMMWNMPREGFRQLYEKLPGPKPPFEEAWRRTGGNPRMLGMLYENRWSWEGVATALMEQRGLPLVIKSLTPTERTWLQEAVEDPDALFTGERINLLDKLTELNMAADIMSRHEHLWADQPPPESDVELGIGRRVAWHTPLHREAVRLALGEAK